MAKPVNRHRDETVDSSLRAFVASPGERVDAVARELAGRHVVPDDAGVRGLRQEVPDHVVHPAFRQADPVSSMEELPDGAILMPTCMMGELGVGVEHGLEPPS